MNRKDNYLDKTCAWLEKILAFVERSKKVPVFYAGRSSSYANEPAPHLELTFLFEGQGVDLSLGTQRHRLAKNHACLHSVHHGSVAQGRPAFCCYCAFLDVSGEKGFAELVRKPVFVQTPIHRPRRMRECFEKLILCCRRYEGAALYYPPPSDFPRRHQGPHPERSSEIFLKASILELLASFLEEARNRDPRSSGFLPDAVRRAQEFLDLNYHRPRLTRDDLSAAAHLSPDHLGRMFRKHLGLSPGQYLRDLRIGRSCLLLRQTALRIEEVGREVGFEDSFYFSRTFRALKGVNPRDYRNS
jgi:AraC-like DNA-binding protein